jgi:hypothetical protein
MNKIISHEWADTDLENLYPEFELARPRSGTRALESPPRSDINLNIPYVHQVFDTEAAFNGHWACGPTSAAMVLAYYGLLQPHALSNPAQLNPYGFYVSSPFEHNGHMFNTTSKTKTGTGAGLYGAIVDFICLDSGGREVWGAYWSNANGKGLKPALDVFLSPHGNTPTIVDRPKQGNSMYLEREAAEEAMVGALDGGHPVIVSGHFIWGEREYHHLVVVRGYYRDEGILKWIVNDPYGFTTTGQRRDYDGENIVYTFEEIKPKWLCVIGGSFVPNKAVRLFDAELNLHVGEGTLVAGTDKVYLKRLEMDNVSLVSQETSGTTPVRLFDTVTNTQVGEGTLIEGTDKVYVKRLWRS